MRKIVIIATIVIAIIAIITFVLVSEYYRSVVIDDVAVRPEEDARYRIIAIDGAVPKRRESWIITMVPYVITSPGKHAVTVEKIVYDDTKTIVSTQIIENEFGSYSKYELDVVSGELCFSRVR